MAVKNYVTSQLQLSGVTISALKDSGLIEKAGGIPGNFFDRLLSGNLKRLELQPLIGLRRLFCDPVDIILGLSIIEYKDRQYYCGFRTIRNMLAGGIPGGKVTKITKAEVCKLSRVNHVLINRIEDFSDQAIFGFADINTSANIVFSALIPGQTFGVKTLIILRNSLLVNIDDILGLGVYDSGVIESLKDDWRLKHEA